MSQAPGPDRSPAGTACGEATGTGLDVKHPTCALCGDPLTSGWTTSVSIDHPLAPSGLVHRGFCCRAHAIAWLTSLDDDPQFRDR